MRPLIENGHVFIAQPPLYKLVRGQQVRYAFSDRSATPSARRCAAGTRTPKSTFSATRALARWTPTSCGETTMDPEKRILIRVDMADAALADETFTALMGDKVESAPPVYRGVCKDGRQS